MHHDCENNYPYLCKIKKTIFKVVVVNVLKHRINF